MDTLFAVDIPVTRALTIRQPWATLIASGAKDVENRSWATSFRGRIAVHAGAATDRAAGIGTPRECPNSVIVGTVEIAGCIRDYASPWAEDGCWHWVLRDPVAFAEPVPCKGKLGLWRLDDETARLVAEVR